MKPPRKRRPLGHGYTHRTETVPHHGDRRLSSDEFWVRVHDLDTFATQLLQHPEAQLVVEAWNSVLVPLARDLLPARELAEMVKKYAHGGSFEELDTEARQRLTQSMVTRLAKILKQGQSNGQQNGNPAGAPGGAAAAGASPPPASGKSGGARGDTPSSTRPQEGGDKHQPSPQPAPQKWDEMSREERQSLADAINNGEVVPTEGTPPPGAKLIDASSLPQDLQDKLKANQQRAHALDERFQEMEEGEDEEEPQGAPEREVAAPKDLSEQLTRAQGLDVRGEGEEAPSHGGANAPDSGEFDDEIRDYIDGRTSPGGNNHSGEFEDIEKMLKAIGHGGGGASMDLKLKFKRPEERLFQVIQEQFTRLGGEPDPSDFLDDGEATWNVRKLLMARADPGVIMRARRDWAKSPEDIYFVLDTSGSMSSFAATIAACAAGALGLVHLFHGMEAHPQFEILRDTPLRHPREFKGLGSLAGGETWEQLRAQNVEKQRLISHPSIPGYTEFCVTHPAVSRGDYTAQHNGGSFEVNLDWWLRKAKPAKGSRLIFFGDAMSVHFANPQYLARLVRPYKFTWLTPHSLEVGERSYNAEHHADLLVNPQRYHWHEWLKLRAVGLQVLGECKDAPTLRAALKKVK